MVTASTVSGRQASAQEPTVSGPAFSAGVSELRFDTDIYSKADRHSAVLFRARMGDPVRVVRREGEFHLLELNGVVGYAWGDVVRAMQAPRPAPAAPVRAERAMVQVSASAPVSARTFLSWGSFALALIVAYTATQPWATLLFLQVRGTDVAQGQAVLLFGLGAAGLALFRALGARNPATSFAQLCCAGIALACSAYVVNAFLSDCGEFQDICAAMIGGGLWSAVLFSGALAALSVVEFVMDINNSNAAFTPAGHVQHQ